MIKINRIILSGNICKDIETKYYNDKKYLRNTIAVRRDFKNKDGNYDSDFLNFTLWGSQAEYLEKYANKGDKIIISGRIANNNYEKDGQTFYSTEIQVDSIELLGKRQKEESTSEELPFDNEESTEKMKSEAKDIFGEDVNFLN